MLITANICTWKPRKHTIDKVIDSIIDQVDITRVYYNDYTPKERNDIVQYIAKGDITDKGKFYGIGRNEIALFMDDDILYPPDYVEKTIERMKDYPGHVVTYHGRKLKGKGLNYYRDHESYHFLKPVSDDVKIDVMGTGVCAFNTNIFMPNIMSYKEDKMVDILASIEAAKNNVPIICLKHNFGWLRVLTNDASIYEEQNMKCDVQNKLTDKLIDIKYATNAFD